MLHGCSKHKSTWFLFMGKQNRQTKLDKTNKNQIKINIKKDLNKKLKTTRDKCSRIT